MRNLFTTTNANKFNPISDTSAIEHQDKVNLVEVIELIKNVSKLAGRKSLLWKGT